MHRTRLRLAISMTTTVALLAIAVPSSATATHRDAVDEAQLVPALSPTFVPWQCQMKPTGPVCTGERHLDDDWAPADLPCETPIWGSRSEDRYQTRYYNNDNLNYYREFRTRDIDYFSTSPTGPATASIRTNVRFSETFGTPGDDTTKTITTTGVIWDLRSDQGPALFRAVGTLVEPYDAAPTFTGLVTAEGVSTRYHEAPLFEILTEEFFVGAVCRAATEANPSLQ
jgi:hypothetical protein